LRYRHPDNNKGIVHGLPVVQGGGHVSGSVSSGSGDIGDGRALCLLLLALLLLKQLHRVMLRIEEVVCGCEDETQRMHQYARSNPLDPLAGPVVESDAHDGAEHDVNVDLTAGADMLDEGTGGHTTGWRPKLPVHSRQDRRGGHFQQLQVPCTIWQSRQ
jgi:hypothetical protein